MSGRTTLLYTLVSASLGLAGISLDPGTITGDTELSSIVGDHGIEGSIEDENLLGELNDEQMMEAAGTIDPTTCPVAGDAGPGDHVVTMEHDGLLRTYQIHVPVNYDSGVPAPVVVNLHGSYPGPEEHPAFSGMNEVSEQNGFIVVYPEGFIGSWNAGECCGAAGLMDIDDVGFITKVVSDVSTRLCIDTERVYAAGFSTGGTMVHRLACDSAGIFAAVGVVGGRNATTSCAPTRPMPIVGYHGTRDDMVQFEDGETASSDWVELNGCVGETTIVDHDASSCVTHDICEGGVDVTFCTIDPMAACWPGGDTDTCDSFYGSWSGDIDASTHMWEFFSAFTLP